MSQNYLKVEFLDSDNTKDVSNLENRNTPFSHSDITLTSIENWEKLNTGEDVKSVYRIDFSRKGIDYQFHPGDAIGILPQNDQSEVDELLLRLNIESQSNKPYKLEVLKGSTKKNTVIPKHIPANGTLKEIFLNNIDIRGTLKKTFLKKLLAYITDPLEKSKLELICSPNGSQEYFKLLEEYRTLLTFLNAYPSCQPPIEIILEQSSALNPRFFSIASSPMNKDIISIIFFLVDHGNGLKGICTGWLSKILENNSFTKTKIPLYFRKPSIFRFKSFEHPIVLIATGTGIAPFRSFLQYQQDYSDDVNDVNKVWLFYGCRYSDRDYLCKNEIEGFYKDGILAKLVTAFSRETANKVYVTNKIYKYGLEIVDLILYRNASLFICGNVKTVVKDIKEVIVQCLVDYGKINIVDSELLVNDLIKKNRFIVDNWI